jgi:hypothetical protein
MQKKFISFTVGMYSGYIVATRVVCQLHLNPPTLTFSVNPEGQLSLPGN